ncbi:MAG: zf-TFIIB domain-containing protein [Deltaproteobacteria bacterium]|nr:zf-TFIIB domain-containing protein [Deltaproteobacteria bacterium]
MPLKPKSQEDEYFAKQEAIKLRKLALKAAQEMAADEKKRLRDLHYMHCPKCGLKMHTVKINAIEVDKCFGCGGLFFDDGELEKVSGRENGFFHAVHEVLDKD